MNCSLVTRCWFSLSYALKRSTGRMPLSLRNWMSSLRGSHLKTVMVKKISILGPIEFPWWQLWKNDKVYKSIRWNFCPLITTMNWTALTHSSAQDVFAVEQSSMFNLEWSGLLHNLGHVQDLPVNRDTLKMNTNVAGCTKLVHKCIRGDQWKK